MTGPEARDTPSTPRGSALRLGLAAALLASSVLFVHVPASLWAGNTAEFTSDARVIAAGVAAAAVALVLVGAVLWLLPGRWRLVASALVAAVGIVWWVDAYFLASGLAVLNGQQAPMGAPPPGWQLWLVAAIGIASAAAVYRWPRPATAVLLMLNVGLAAGTIATVWRAPRLPAAADAPDVARLMRFAPHDNVLIVLLDALQSDVAHGVFDRDVALRGAFEGFVFYRDTVGASPTTFLAIPAIHSGEVYAGQGAAGPYFTEAITKRSFLSRFVAAGYDATLINPISGICPQDVGLCAKIAQVLPGAGTPAVQDSLRLFDLALFRVSPPSLRPWIYADGRWRASRVAAAAPDEPHYIAEGTGLLRELTRRMVVSAGAPTVKFLHLFPTHPPLVLGDDCQIVEASHSLDRAPAQSRCALMAVAGLFDAMRHAGIYDDALILVLSDHGLGRTSGYVDQAEERPTDWLARAAAANPTLLLKRRGSRGPLQDSSTPVHLADVGTTLCRLSGACTAPAGFVVGEAPADRPRRFNSYTWTHERWTSLDVPDLTPYDIRGPVWTQHAWSRAHAETYRLGDTVAFGKDGTGGRYVTFGWGSSEPWGRWTTSREAQLTLRIASPPGRPLELVARVMPFIPPAPGRQAVTWVVNDQVLETWTFTTGGVSEQRLTIPAAAVGPDGYLRVMLRIETPMSPAELALSPDTRRLGLGVHEITLRAPGGREREAQRR